MRLLPGYFSVTLEAQRKNPNFGSNVAGVTPDDKAREWNWLSSAERAYYFSPLLNANSLVHSVELIVNGKPLQTSREGYMDLYSALTRTFTTGDLRKRYLGHNFAVSTSAQHTEKTTAGSDAAFAYAAEKMTFGRTGADGKGHTITGEFDGLLFFSRPICWTKVSRGGDASIENELPLIPPHQQISLRFKLIDPLQARLCDGKQTGAVYMKAAKPQGADQADLANVKLTITNMSLAVQVLELDTDTLRKMSSAANYYLDVAEFRRATVPEGKQFFNIGDSLPAGVTLLFASFMWGHQSELDDATYSRCADQSKFTLPYGFQKVVFKVNGKIVLFPDGLRIPYDSANESQDARLYYQYLVSRNLTDDTFESFFPRREGAVDGSVVVGYKQAFCLDLSYLKLKEPSEFTAEFTFDGTKVSPQNLFLVLSMPVVGNFSKPGNQHYWEVEMP